MTESDEETTLIEATAQRVGDEPDPNEHVIEIQYGDGRLLVTRKAKQSMSMAVDASSNQPTLFFKSLYVIHAVCDILGLDMLQYSFPQTMGEINNFNWNAAKPDDKSTYPTGIQPSDEEFEKVRSVHKLVKGEKDEEARSCGRPKSGVQSYITVKQKWKLWRDICALYRMMNPALARHVLLDLITAELKLCKSMQELERALEVAVKQHIERLKRQARKRRAQTDINIQLAEATRKEQEAKKSVEEAEAERTRLVQEKQQVETQALANGRTRLQREAAKRAAVKDVEE